MKTESGNRQHLIFGLLIYIAVLGIYIFGLVIADANTRAALLSGTAAAIVAIYTLKKNKQAEIAAMHRERKAEGYHKYTDPFIDMGGNHKQITPKKFETSMLEFRKVLLIWGNEHTIKIWNEAALAMHENAKSEDPAPLASLIVQGELMKVLRQDLGHDDLNLKAADLMKILLAAESHREIDALFAEVEAKA